MLFFIIFFSQLSAYYELLKSVEEFSLALGTQLQFVSQDKYNLKLFAFVEKHQGSAVEHLQIVEQYLEAESLVLPFLNVKNIEKMLVYL